MLISINYLQEALSIQISLIPYVSCILIYFFEQSSALALSKGKGVNTSKIKYGITLPILIRRKENQRDKIQMEKPKNIVHPVVSQRQEVGTELVPTILIPGTVPHAKQAGISYGIEVNN
jgi:hypothetical protein